MSCSHLTIFERVRIETLSALNYSTHEISEEIGRCHTIVSKRHTKPNEENQSERAQASYEERRTNCGNHPSRLNKS